MEVNRSACESFRLWNASVVLPVQRLWYRLTELPLEVKLFIYNHSTLVTQIKYISHKNEGMHTNFEEIPHRTEE
jgi:hypothetical protein